MSQMILFDISRAGKRSIGQASRYQKKARAPRRMDKVARPAHRLAPGDDAQYLVTSPIEYSDRELADAVRLSAKADITSTLDLQESTSIHGLSSVSAHRGYGHASELANAYGQEKGTFSVSNALDEYSRMTEK